MNPLRLGTLLVGLFATAACYSYHTIPVDEVRPDLPVRLRVRPEATERVSQVVGYVTQDVDGTVISLQRDTVLLTVRSPAPSSQGGMAQQLYQRLDVPVSQLIEVQRRQFSRTKTYVCIAAAAAGAGVLAVWAFTSPSIFASQSTPPVTNNGLVPAGLLARPGLRLPLGYLRLGR